jgi:hypothetical protein
MVAENRWSDPTNLNLVEKVALKLARDGLKNMRRRTLAGTPDTANLDRERRGRGENGLHLWRCHAIY